MTHIEFSDIKFSAEKNNVRIDFLKIFSSQLDLAMLERIGKFKVKDGGIDFETASKDAVMKKLMPALDNAFRGLRSKLTGRKTVYVHRNSGIPLIGTLYFGIVDRGTNILELKPITGCNISCLFCSVGEAKESKTVDFVVEDEYLIEETRRIVTFKQQDKETKIDLFINTHGEPLLYSSIARLVKGLREIPQVNTISIITNGTLLTKKLADELVDAGLSQVNISINAIDPQKAKQLAGYEGYSIKDVLESARHISKKIKTVIAPVWIKGTNDEEIPNIIAFAKEIGAEIGIQNYMVHKLGMKMAKQTDWEEFYSRLEDWEKQTGADLKFKGHHIFKTKTLPEPFRKGEIVRAQVISVGRMNNETLAAAKGRVISVLNCNKEKGEVKIRILKDKDNVFVAEEA